MTDITSYFPESSKQIEQVWNVETPYLVTHIVTPSLTNLPFAETKDLICCEKELWRIRELMKELVDSEEEVFKEIDSLKLFSVSSTKIEAFHSTEAVLQELKYGNYSKESVQEYAQWVLKLLLNHLNGGAVLEQRKIEALKRDFFENNVVTVTPRSEEESNNPSFIVTTDQNKALLKIAKNPMEASHKFVIEDFPLLPTPTNEIAGYEASALYGFGNSPETIELAVKTPKNEHKIATLQQYIPKCTSFYDLYVQPNKGQTLKGLNKANVDVAVLASIIDELAAGHIDNYAIDEKMRLKSFDKKECFPPFNRMPKEYRVRRLNVEELKTKKNDLQKIVECTTDVNEKTKVEEQLKKVNERLQDEDLDAKQMHLQKLIETTTDIDEKVKVQEEIVKLKKRFETERKSIVMARMCILGLPQCDKPFDRAALMILTHASFKPIMKAHHQSIIDNKYPIKASALDAQMERLYILQDLAQKELDQKEITLTPRKVFFEIFGGEELFNIAIKKGYNPLIIFNNVISPYRAEFKDLSQPDTMKGRPKDRPGSDSEESKNAFENMKVLYSQD